MVASSSAMKGSPRKARTGWMPASAGTTFATEFAMMSSSGIMMMPTMVLNLGSLLSSMSACCATCSGTAIIYFLPQMEPQMGPAAIMAKMPQKMPMRMTQPRSTPSMVATRTGPGVGGM